MMQNENKYFKIEVNSHNFAVQVLTHKGRELCYSFAKKFLEWGWESKGGRNSRVVKQTYASSNSSRTIFRFHRNTYDDFIAMLNDRGLYSNFYEVSYSDDYEAVDAEFIIKEGITPRDYQLAAIEYLEQPTPINKILELRTGLGKTLISQFVIAKLGKRVACVIRPQYIEKWISDFKTNYSNITDDDIVVIQGSKALRLLIEKAISGDLTEKIILISTSTFRNWITLYEEKESDLIDLGYACAPDKLFEILKVGLRLIDECHQEFHFFFKLDTYTHVPKSISLSATLINKNDFIVNMYETMFPRKHRMAKLAANNFINVFAMHYYLRKPEKVRTSYHGSKNYSHNAFEESILRHYPTKMNYFNLVDFLVQIGYIKNKKDNEKLLIYASTVDMCTQLTDYLKGKYPNLSVKRYVDDDPYENVINSDIRVSTIGSAGAALDINGLSCVIMTIAVDSLQANAQAVGRLRYRLGDKTEFYYLVADNVPKHVQYHIGKKLQFKELTKTHKDISYGPMV